MPEDQTDKPDAPLEDTAEQEPEEPAPEAALAELDAPPADAGDEPGAPEEPADDQAPEAPAAPDASGPQLSGLELMLDVPLDVTVELGRTTMQLGEALALQSGCIIELDRLPGEPLDMHINDRLVARGEVVVINEALGLRVTETVGQDTHRARSSVVSRG